MTLQMPLTAIAGLADPAVPGTQGGRAWTDIKGLEALKADSSSPQAMQRVAQEVEAMFLQMMLKSMRDASQGDGIFDSQEGRLYQDMFDKQIALDMSQHQHVGIAAMLMRQLSHTRSVDPGALPGLPVSGGLEPPAGVASPASSAAGVGTADVDRSNFITRILPAIRTAARKLGVDARGLMAQAALETGWGQRIPRNADGSSSHNLFGVKAGAGWRGARATAVTLEFDGTAARRRTESFRSYASMEEGVDDFVQLLSGSPRYAQALASGRSPFAYARSLAAAGYATDPEYASKINRILGSARMREAFPVRTASLQE